MQILGIFLFPGVHNQWQDWVDANVEFREVIIHVGLADLGICHQDKYDESMQIDTVEALDRIIQYGVVEVIDNGGKLVAGDGEDQAIGCLFLAIASGSVGGT